MRLDAADRPAPNPLVVNLREASRLLGVQRTSLYALMREGRLARCKIGRRTLVTLASIKQLVAEGLDVGEGA